MKQAKIKERNTSGGKNILLRNNRQQFKPFTIPSFLKK